MDDDGGVTISKRTWHYRRYIDWTARGKVIAQENLCHYMKAVIMGVILGVVTWIGDHSPRIVWRSLGAATTYGVLLGLLGLWTLMVVSMILDYGWITVLVWACAIVAGVVIAGVLVGLTFVWLEDRRLPSVRESSTAVLIGSWVMARKRRICPFIEFVD